jgi:hypothetical protein
MTITLRIWLYLIAAWTITMLAWPCFGQTLMLSWPVNGNYSTLYTVMQSTNGGKTWQTNTVTERGYCLIDATNQQPSPVWITNGFQGMNYWSNDCTPYYQFQVYRNFGTTNVFTTMTFSNGLPWFTDYWAYADSFKVKITNLP